MSQIVCSVCGKGGHSSSKCKELGIPPDGFYRPTGGGQHHHEDEDEKAYRQQVLLEDTEAKPISINRILHAYNMWYYNILRTRQVTETSIKSINNAKVSKIVF